MSDDSRVGGAAGGPWRRLLVTLAALVLFQLAAQLSAPGVGGRGLGDQSLRGSEPREGLSVLGLGLSPFVTGFLVVELLSFALPPGRRLRRRGIAGRRRLNAWALGAGCAVAAVQALGIAIFFERTLGSTGLPLVEDPGWGFRLGAVATLLGGTLLTYLLARAVSAWGLGNGFLVFLVLPLVVGSITELRGLPASGGSALLPSPAEPVIWLAAFLLLLRTFARPGEVQLGTESEERVPLAPPAFPQGLVPLGWTYALLDPYWTWIAGALGEGTSRLIAVAGATILLVGLSPAAFHLFSSRRRLQNNLPDGTLLPDGEPMGGRRLAGTTALLLVFGVGFPVGEIFLGFRFTAVLGFNVLVLLIAAGFDLAREWRFRAAQRGEVARLLELDNVHLASYLRGLLAAHGVDTLVRSYHYRSLFFFFEPLVKMELLVPAAELDRARQVVRPEGIAIV